MACQPAFIPPGNVMGRTGLLHCTVTLGDLTSPSQLPAQVSQEAHRCGLRGSKRTARYRTSAAKCEAQTLIKLEKTSFLGWCQATGGWELKVVRWPPGALVEPESLPLNRGTDIRLVAGESKASHGVCAQRPDSETRIEVATTRVLVARLAQLIPLMCQTRCCRPSAIAGLL